VTIPPEEKDPALFDKLKAEASGILAWAVRGCLEWQREGLRPPEAVKAATEAYRDEMDVFGAFLDERCTRARGATVRAKELYEAYRQWCDECGQGTYSQHRFGKALAERGITREKDRAGWFYLGIGLAVTDVTDCDPFSGVLSYFISHEEITPKKGSQRVTSVTETENHIVTEPAPFDEGVLV